MRLARQGGTDRCRLLQHDVTTVAWTPAAIRPSSSTLHCLRPLRHSTSSLPAASCRLLVVLLATTLPTGPACKEEAPTSGTSRQAMHQRHPASRRGRPRLTPRALLDAATQPCSTRARPILPIAPLPLQPLPLHGWRKLGALCAHPRRRQGAGQSRTPGRRLLQRQCHSFTPSSDALAHRPRRCGVSRHSGRGQGSRHTSRAERRHRGLLSANLLNSS